MNKTIMKFTAMSACLDPMKLLYVLLLAFVMPIGLKVVSMFHGVSDSQTFEMLTGKVGVAFVLMVLCLGLAGNSTTQSGRGGEYLPLIFSRPVSRREYVISKWLVIALIGGALTALQNLVIAGIGFAFGETITLSALACMLVERFLDAALISAAMILTMLNPSPLFQVTAMLGFYVWLTGQTVPPVSVAGATCSANEISTNATKLLISGSQFISELILPTVNVYDLFNKEELPFAPLVAYASAICMYLSLSIIVTNKREFYYGAK